ncbi:MAG: cysteine peptidase family C39 domain-containing protein [Methanobrevibacter sp.]
MNFKSKLILLCLIIILFNIGAVSAHDDNLTDENLEVETQNNILTSNSDFQHAGKIQSDNVNLSNGILSSVNINESSGSTFNNGGKLDITLSPINTKIFVGEKFAVRFVDQNGDSYANLPVFIKVDGKNFKSLTDRDGVAVFSLNNDLGVFSVELIYLGNARYNPYSQSVKVTLQKYNATLTPVNTNLMGDERLKVHFEDELGNSYANLPVFIRVDGKNFKSLTDRDGFAVFSLSKDSGVFSVELIYLGNARYNPYSQVVKISLQKYNVILTPVNTALVGGEDLRVLFKDQFNKSYANLPVFVKVDGKNFKSVTDGDGFAVFSLSKDSGVFYVELIYLGNARYNPYSQVVKINLNKYDVTLTPLSTSINNGKPLKILFKDQFGRSYANLPVFVKINGRNYKGVTDKNGYADININLNSGKIYSAELIYQGNKQYNPYSKECSISVLRDTSIVIGNDKLLKGGFLRVYLKSDESWVISKQTLTIKIGTKTFVETTNSEGMVIIKPNMTKRTYTVDVTYNGTNVIAGSHVSKQVEGIYGYAINPLYGSVPSKNGMPDIDYMDGNCVMADGDWTYTVLKSQYRDVLLRDSYCLFLTNKLTKYVLFKTKSEPGLNHLIHRTKWNVIEREINTQIVRMNRYDYWPDEITVSLKGKSYTYSEVRDVQNTDYTCGPTSCSMCSQVLRNYVNEAYLAVKAGSTYSEGSSTAGLKYALEQFNMKCSYFYQSSFDNALNELKKGGCALIFHTWNHYVAILDISSDGNKVLVGNPSGDYDHGSHSIPTNWLTVDYMKGMFNNYDTSSLIVKLDYSLSQSTKDQVIQFYDNMGSWTRQNTNERIPQI